MGKNDNREFCEEEASKIWQLYKTEQDIINKKPSINLYGHTITYTDIQKSMNLDFISQVPKNCCIDTSAIDPIRDGKKVMENLNTLIKVNNKVDPSVLLNIVKLVDIPEVKFEHGELKKKKDGSFVYLAPRFTINISKSDIKPNSGVCINTGYIVKIPNNANKYSIVNNKIEVNNVYAQQTPVVVMPVILTCPGIIPCFYARDPEDTGLLTINFTTTADFVVPKQPIKIILNAYAVSNSLSEVRLTSNDVKDTTTDSTVFKTKDLRAGRYVKNLKCKFVSDSCVLNNNTLTMKVIDVEKSVISDNRLLHFDSTIALFTSRKREWCNPKLVTLSGIFNVTSKCKLIKPIIAPNSEYLKKNTHCVSLITGQVTVFSRSDDSVLTDCRILNGAASNIPDYENIRKSIRTVIQGINGLCSGVKSCNKFIAKNPDVDFKKMMCLYDHHKSIDSRDVKLIEKINSDEKTMYDTRVVAKKAHSVQILKGFKQLSMYFLPHLFTQAQLDELAACCQNKEKDNLEEEEAAAENSNNNSLKRKQEEINDDTNDIDEEDKDVNKKLKIDI
jgi:hypothetical protein